MKQQSQYSPVWQRCGMAFLALLLFSAPAAARQPPTLPPSIGVTTTAVTQDNLPATICKPGYTTTVRPNTSYTNSLKRILIQEEVDQVMGHWELDHIVSLQLGGHPTAPGNLWMQHYSGPCGARVKDSLEGKLKRMVCKGVITLLQAQLEIGTDWVKAYNQHIGPLSCSVSPTPTPLEPSNARPR